MGDMLASRIGVAAINLGKAAWKKLPVLAEAAQEASDGALTVIKEIYRPSNLTETTLTSKNYPLLAGIIVGKLVRPFERYIDSSIPLVPDEIITDPPEPIVMVPVIAVPSLEQQGPTGPTKQIIRADLSPGEIASTVGIPIGPDAQCRVSSDFGPRTAPQTNSGGGVGSADHKGVDFAIPEGTPVYVPFLQGIEGKVIGLGSSDEGYGNFIRIQAQGIVFTFAHLSSIEVEIGDTVKGGQRIGLSGNTGNSQGPHLHFEMTFYDPTKNDWVPINPAISGHQFIIGNACYETLEVPVSHSFISAPPQLVPYSYRTRTSQNTSPA